VGEPLERIAKVTQNPDGSVVVRWLGTSMRELWPSVGAAIDSVETTWATIIWENSAPGEWLASEASGAPPGCAM
jgi:hypothetical protein